MTIGHQLPKNRPQRTLITWKIDMVIFHTHSKMSSILEAILEQLKPLMMSTNYRVTTRRSLPILYLIHYNNRP